MIAAGGCALQYALWARSAPGLGNPDSLGFWRIGHGLETDLRSLLYRPKLYPWFLGVFAAPKAAAFGQCLLKLGMAVWIGRAARALRWKASTAAFALALFFADGLWLREPLHLYDTTLFAFLFLGALVLALETILSPHPLRFAAFCALAAPASLCRQVGDPFLAMAGAAALARIVAARPRARIPSAAVAAAALALAGAGAILNGAQHGIFVRSVALGVNVYTHYAYYELADGASPEWDYVAAHLPGVRETLPPWRTAWQYDMPWEVNALPHRLERALRPDGPRRILAADSALTARALAGMAGKPGRYLGAFANEMERLLLKCEGGYPDPLIAAGPAGLRLQRGLMHAPLWLLALAGVAGLILGRGVRAALALPFAAACGYLSLIAAVQIGLYRYGLPAWPLLLIPAAHALDRLTPERKAAAEARGP
jgi:hypothetical protein